jgi:hypothetical protein
METLTINIPEDKSSIVKQILQELGVTILNNDLKKRKPSEFAGIISKEKARELLRDIEKERKEWERVI